MNAPIPVYCRTPENKITFCNHQFALLYGKDVQWQDLEGLYRITQSEDHKHVHADYDHVFKWDTNQPRERVFFEWKPGVERFEIVEDFVPAETELKDVQSFAIDAQQALIRRTETHHPDEPTRKSLFRAQTLNSPEAFSKYTLKFRTRCSKDEDFAQTYLEHGTKHDGTKITKITHQCK